MAERRQNGTVNRKEAEGKMEPPQVLGFQVCVTGVQTSPNSLFEC